jgi:ABC-type transporter Mla MlaB component
VAVRPGEHACCHFADADDRERLTIGFVHDRLRHGHKVVYLFDDDDEAAVVARLERLDAAFEPARARGQFEVRRAQAAYLADGCFDPERLIAMLHQEHERAHAEGYTGLGVIGEMPAAVCEAPGGDQLAAYEAQVDAGIDGAACSILCQYDHGRFNGDVMSDVIRAHQLDASPELAAIGRDGDLAAARDREHDALRLAGELDFGCAQTVSDVLDAHFDGPLRLDLADLSYVDVAGMRALRHKGQHLTISPVSDAVQRLLALLGWDTDPDVELLEAG